MLAAITLSRINKAFAASMATLAEMPGRQNMLRAVWMSALAPACLVLGFTIRCTICVFAMLAAITLPWINKAFAARTATLAEMLGRPNMLRHD